MELNHSPLLLSVLFSTTACSLKIFILTYKFSFVTSFSSHIFTNYTEIESYFTRDGVS
jgi:hypothetical protein